jgi:hypothetical protein
MAVISFTADDGRPDQLESDTIVRVRRILDSERQQHNANTKIIWSRDSYAKETPAAFIGLLTSVEGVSKWLGELTMPEGSPVWFNGKLSEGPIRVTPSNMPPGAKSGLLIAGKLQYVANTAQEVQNVVKAKGGTALPVPGDSILELPANAWVRAKGWIAPYEVWDAESPQG